MDQPPPPSCDERNQCQMLKECTIEVVAIGNELLQGHIVNTNAAEIGKALFTAGYYCRRQSVLPDAKALLKKGLHEALQHHQVVITTGGLGPTCDDTTRQVAAELFDSPVAINAELSADLKKRYGDLPISLEDQATVPTKAFLIKNPLGTAPGFIFNDGKRTLILMPGVPPEMRAMLNAQVIPYLLKHFPPKMITKATAHFFALSESAIDPAIRDLEKRFPTIQFGIYPSQGTLTIRASTDEGEPSLVNAAINALIQRFPKKYFSSESIEEAIQELFIQNNWTLSTAESCTGGAIAAKLTKIAGASNYFIGSIVSYSNEMKKSLLHVPKDTLDTHGAVSEQTVSAMATGVLTATGSTFAIAVSGIAGPTGGTPEKPVGTVWIAIAKQGEPPFCKLLHARGNREMNIERSVNAALGDLLTYCRK